MDLAPSHRRHLWMVVLLAIVVGMATVGFCPVRGAAAQPLVSSGGFISVAVVVEVDHHITVRCVTVRRGANAFEILVAVSESLGWPPPTTDATWPGFICSVNAKPTRSTSCLSHFSATAPTWGFWLAKSGSWHYATMGAASTRPQDGDIEAWVEEPGTASHGKVLPPTPSANFTALCAHQSARLATVAAHGGRSGVLVSCVLVVVLGLAARVIARTRRKRE